MELALLFALSEWQVIRAAMGKEFMLNWLFVLVTILVICSTLGYYFWQAYQNR